jgi:hypothetical protein
LLGLLLGALFAGATSFAREEDKKPAEPNAGELERLRALGYIDFSDEAVPADRAGVVYVDTTRSEPGYNLFASRPLLRAELIDARGNVVRAWQGEGKGHWAHVRMLENGDLLVVGSAEIHGDDGHVDSEALYVERRTFDDRLLWRRELPVHHDIAQAPDGRLAAIFSEDRLVPEIDGQALVRDEGLIFLTGAGDVTERQLFVPMLLARPSLFRFQPVQRRRPKGILTIDLLHTNSIHWIDKPALAARNPIYALGNALVCLRNQDTLAIFDWKSRQLLWAFGQGELRGPHDASLLDDGLILAFDNRLGEGWSRVVEIDPLERRIVWEYRAPNPTDFYTKMRGGVQRLANGNTLIAESERGHAFEVTRAGAVVWDYWTPHRDENGHPATIIRMVRHAPELVERLLAQHATGR